MIGFGNGIFQRDTVAFLYALVSENNGTYKRTKSKKHSSFSFFSVTTMTKRDKINLLMIE